MTGMSDACRDFIVSQIYENIAFRISIVSSNQMKRKEIPIMFTKEWLKAALIRAVRTFAEAALAYIGTGACVLGDVNWLGVLSAGAFGAVTAILLALAGLPEAEGKPIE